MDYHILFREQWDRSATSFPRLEKTFQLDEKLEKEKRFDNFFAYMKGKYPEGLFPDVTELKKDLLSFMTEFFREDLGYDDDQLQVILSEEMMRSTSAFVHKARHFDPELRIEDIFQACRNVWIMNGLQYLFDLPVTCTSSIFAYSMLYPYTDNLVDDPAISEKSKAEFSERFSRRLAGVLLHPENRTEEKIYALVEMIEAEWPRAVFPEVYESLLAIHDAQTESIRLMDKKHLKPDEIFRICAEKGGTSVVADGCLILGKLSSQQSYFMYAYGAYLQLLDDLQDVKEDYADGIMTYFSEALKHSKLDDYLCRTFHLGAHVTSLVDEFELKGGTAFNGLILKSIDLFLLQSVVTNKSYFSRRFVRQFEQYSPFRYSFIRRRRSTLSPYQKMLYRSVGKYLLTKGPSVISLLAPVEADSACEVAVV